jgi:hypothetical protein
MATQSQSPEGNMKGSSVSQSATVEIAPIVIGRQQRAKHRFYISAAVFLILLNIMGFGPSLMDPSRRNASPSPLAMMHGMVAGAWLLLLLAQVTLVATRRTAIHRRLGIIGPVLATAMIVLGYAALIGLARRGHDLSGDVLRALSRSGRPLKPTGLLFPLAELLEFGVLVGMGLWYRHRPEIHKRLMLFAVVPMATEPILHLVGYLSAHWPILRGAWPIISLPVLLLFLSTSAIYDRVSRGHIHPVSLWVPILLVAWRIVLVAVVLPSTAWRTIAAWLIA